MGASLRVTWTRRATRHLHSAWDYVARDSVESADRLLVRIFNAVEALAEYPHMGRPGRVPGSRELVITGTPYVAAYQLEIIEVRILAVFHGSRRWPERL